MFVPFSHLFQQISVAEYLGMGTSTNAKKKVFMNNGTFQFHLVSGRFFQFLTAANYISCLSENWFYPEAHSALKFLHCQLLPTSEVSSHMVVQYGTLYSTCYTGGDILVNINPLCSRNCKRRIWDGAVRGLPRFWQRDIFSLFCLRMLRDYFRSTPGMQPILK